MWVGAPVWPGEGSSVIERTWVSWLGRAFNDSQPQAVAGQRAASPGRGGQLHAACAAPGAPLRVPLCPGVVALLLQSIPVRSRFVLVPEAGDVYAETSE